MSNTKKNFSVMKWIIFPLLVLGFGIGIAYVSTKIFGAEGSVPTYLLLLVCLAISLIFIWHTSNHHNKAAKIAAFSFECAGVLALGFTLICSIVILREFSGMSETVAQQNAQDLKKGEQNIQLVKEIGKLKSARAQATVTKTVVTQEENQNKITLADAFSKAERWLLWPLIGEVAVYVIGLMVVFGMVSFLGKDNEEPDEPLFTTGNAKIKFLQPQAPFRTSNSRSNQKIGSLTLYGQQSGFRVHDAQGYIGHISYRKFDQNNPLTEQDVRGLL